MNKETQQSMKGLGWISQSNLGPTLEICALRPSFLNKLHSTFCIVSQIFGALYALRPAPNFYEIHPWPLTPLSNPKLSHQKSKGPSSKAYHK
jgi:hypothetical protein